MSVSLICEGRCNPGRVALEEQIERIRREPDLKVRAILLAGARQLLRADLRYTSHAIVGPARNTAICQTCYHVRRYGGRSVPLVNAHAEVLSSTR